MARFEERRMREARIEARIAERRRRDARIESRIAETDRRRAVADHRRAVYDRRAGFRRASSVADRAPGILSSVLALIFVCLIGSRFLMVLAGTSEIEYFFENDLAITEEFIPALGMTTAFAEEGEDPWFEGKYITISDTVDEIEKLSNGESDPFKLFGALVRDNVKGIIGSLGGDIGKKIYETLGWIQENEEWLDWISPFNPSVHAPIIWWM